MPCRRLAFETRSLFVADFGQRFAVAICNVIGATVSPPTDIHGQRDACRQPAGYQTGHASFAAYLTRAPRGTDFTYLKISAPALASASCAFRLSISTNSSVSRDIVISCMKNDCNLCRPSVLRIAPVNAAIRPYLFFRRMRYQHAKASRSDAQRAAECEMPQFPENSKIAIMPGSKPGSTAAPIRGVPQGACRTQNPRNAKARR